MSIRYISGRPKSDPEFYKKHDYWFDAGGLIIEKAVVVVPLTGNDLARAIVLEARRQGIPVKGETPQIQKEVDELLSAT